MVDDIEGTVKMPPAIAEAVLKVMSALGTLGKDQENKFDKYEYASIDDFIKFVRAHCIEAGLFIVPQEANEPSLKEMKKKDGSPLMMWWSRFAFMLFHKDGESYGPIYKTVMVQANGAQAAGAAQSYALKQLMRGLFLIPTGDKDDPDKTSADFGTREDTQTDLQKEAVRIRNAILKAKDLDALNEAWEVNALRIEEIKEVSSRAWDALDQAFNKRKEDIEK
ncbi:MAG: ERF family protein [bacterium]